MNSREYWGLAEAYAEVYAQEQIDEVSDILESEDCISEMGQVRTTGQNPSVYRSSTPSAGSAGASGSGGRRGSGSSPGALRPSATAPKPAPAPKPTPRPAAAPAPKPVTTASRPVATASRPTTAPAAKPAPTASSTPSSAAPAAPKRTFNPLMQKTFGYQTGYAPSQVKGDIKKMAQMGSLKAGFDMFDLVKGHLLDEGYADTEEAAIKIMANMSEEWRESILDEASRRDEFTRAAIARSSGRKGGITFEPGPNWDPSANRGKGAHISPKQKEKQRRKALRQEEYVDEAQHARENPEKYESDQKKKTSSKAMPPRGDKRREEFEKWYAKNVR